MTLQNSFNLQFLGFSKGSIPVTDPTGKILEQKAPSDGQILIADSTQSTGYSFANANTAATPSVTLNGVFGSAQTILDVNNSYNITINGDQGIVTYGRNNAVYILNTAPAMNKTLLTAASSVTNGISYEVKNSSATPFALTLTYTPTNVGEYGTYSEECQFYNSASGTFKMQTQGYPIQFGNQTVPANSYLSSSQIGDCITLRMSVSKTSWIVTNSVGTFSISSS